MQKSGFHISELCHRSLTNSFIMDPLFFFLFFLFLYDRKRSYFCGNNFIFWSNRFSYITITREDALRYCNWWSVQRVNFSITLYFFIFFYPRISLLLLFLLLFCKIKSLLFKFYFGKLFLIFLKYFFNELYNHLLEF